MRRQYPSLDDNPEKPRESPSPLPGKGAGHKLRLRHLGILHVAPHEGPIRG